jgi:AbrB family looped-hinge helix DNA binding protein
MRVTVSSKGQLVIPGAIRKALGLDPGTQLDVHVVGRTIVLEPVQQTSPLDALYGRFASADLLGDLEAEHRDEVARERAVRP